MVTSGDQGRELLDRLGALDAAALRALSQRARGSGEPPAFRGRCLEPGYLEAVASGRWAPSDEDRLAHVVRLAEEVALPRVPRRDRRGLRTALRATAVACLTDALPPDAAPSWSAERERWAAVWQDAVGPLPVPATA